MRPTTSIGRRSAHVPTSVRRLGLGAGLLLATWACGSSGGAGTSVPGPAAASLPAASSIRAPEPDPRVGLAPGLLDAGEAIWNLRLVSATPPPAPAGAVQAASDCNRIQ